MRLSADSGRNRDGGLQCGLISERVHGVHLQKYSWMHLEECSCYSVWYCDEFGSRKRSKEAFERKKAPMNHKAQETAPTQMKIDVEDWYTRGSCSSDLISVGPGWPGLPMIFYLTTRRSMGATLTA
jgi:hypothetical protein